VELLHEIHVPRVVRTVEQTRDREAALRTAAMLVPKIVMLLRAHRVTACRLRGNAAELEADHPLRRDFIGCVFDAADDRQVELVVQRMREFVKERVRHRIARELLDRIVREPFGAISLAARVP